MDFLGMPNKKGVLDTGKTTLNNEFSYLEMEAKTLPYVSQP